MANLTDKPRVDITEVPQVTHYQMTLEFTSADIENNPAISVIWSLATKLRSGAVMPEAIQKVKGELSGWELLEGLAATFAATLDGAVYTKNRFGNPELVEGLSRDPGCVILHTKPIP